MSTLFILLLYVSDMYYLLKGKLLQRKGSHEISGHLPKGLGMVLLFRKYYFFLNSWA